MRTIIKAVHVRAIRPSSPKGVLILGHMTIPCAIGHAGMRVLKREGDGATPIGRWRFGQLFWRPDRRGVPVSSLPSTPLTPEMGWCDAPADRNYNRPVTLPYPAGHEELWRKDGLYDVVVTLSHNTCPLIRGHGSAVFFHLASQDLKPTAGCIAVRGEDVARVLRHIGPQTLLVVGNVPARPVSDGQKLPIRRAHGLRDRR
jgi:L,D-peptidoglycan transpeptidase YkuD (ErfK/YbiS/YcfS/YnhG family)